MTKKEQEPIDRNENRDQERERHLKDIDYNPDITDEDKEVLNNQSQDEKKGDYFEDRKEPIDYAGDDLDIPELDEKQFNQSVSKPDDTEKEKRPKNSANTNEDLESESAAETIYKGEDAEKYRDPSQGKNDRRNDPAGPEDDAGAGMEGPDLDEDPNVARIVDQPKDFDNDENVMDPGSQRINKDEEEKTERDPSKWRKDKKPGKDGGVL